MEDSDLADFYSGRLKLIESAQKTLSVFAIIMAYKRMSAEERRLIYKWLDEKGKLIKTFKPDQDTPGEELRIYRITSTQ